MRTLPIYFIALRYLGAEKKTVCLSTNQKQTKCFGFLNCLSAWAEGEIKQQKIQQSLFKKKGLFKPAQILKLSVFCSKQI